MKLYHLTSLYHLPAIMSTGYLKVVESNISLVPHEEHVGPDVVWLTTNRRPRQGWATMRPGTEYVDKCRIVFEVDVADDAVHPWYDWAREHGARLHDMTALAASGDERHNRLRLGVRAEADQASLELARAEWFVVERAVPWLEWVSVTDRLAGTVLWRNTTEQQKSGKLTVSKLWLSQRWQRAAGGQVMLQVQPEGDPTERPWVPTTIISEENPGVAIQIGGEGPPDIVIDGRESHTVINNDTGESMQVSATDKEMFEAMTPAERRQYFGRVAPSINIMHDLFGLDDDKLDNAP